MKSSRAFTLIEMLCVVALVVGLAILGFPFFKNVLRRAGEARCISNLRQFGLAVQNYASEHNMDLPPGNNDGSEWFKLNSTSWFRQYAGDNSEDRAKRLMCCPGDLTGPPISDYRYYYSYTWNSALLQVYINGRPAHDRIPTKIHTVMRKVLFADAITNAEDSGLVAKYPPSVTDQNTATRISQRHHGGAHCLFGDGSVRWLSQEDALVSTLYSRSGQ